MNKTQTISGQYRGTHLSILQNAKTLQYAWNSASTDNAYLTLSLADVGRDFLFPLDIEISGITNLYNYLRGVSAYSAFDASAVKFLVEE